MHGRGHSDFSLVNLDHDTNALAWHTFQWEIGYKVLIYFAMNIHRLGLFIGKLYLQHILSEIISCSSVLAGTNPGAPSTGVTVLPITVVVEPKFAWHTQNERAYWKQDQVWNTYRKDFPLVTTMYPCNLGRYISLPEFCRCRSRCCLPHVRNVYPTWVHTTL